MSLELYDYQHLTISMIRDKMRSVKRVVLCLPTGGGKTIIFSYIANAAIEKGTRVLICVHRNELKEQAERTTKATVVMVETLANRIKSGKISLSDFDLVIIDEAHVGNFRKILISYQGFVIAATATPVTTNKKFPISQTFQDIIVPISITELIAKGRLSTPRSFARVPVNFSDLKKVGGEYSEKSQMQVFNTRQVFAGLLEDYKLHCVGKKGIIFCSSIPHTISVYEALKEQGVNVFMVHSKMKERDQPVTDFLTSTDGVIVNCGILTTGFDCPDLNFVMLNRATTSLILLCQMIGRGSRVTETKNTFDIYDYGMNIVNLGFWEQPRDWTKIFFQTGKEKKLGAAPNKICPSCSAVNISTALNCKYCGHEFEARAKEISETKLQEMVYKHSLNRHIYDLTTDELLIVAKNKNYKQQFVERVIYHAHGLPALHSYWDQKNYKSGYRDRRIDLFRTETPVSNFIVKP